VKVSLQVRRRHEPNRSPGACDQRRNELRKEVRTLGDDRRLSRQSAKIIDDHLKPFARVRKELLGHLFGLWVQPSLVHRLLPESAHRRKRAGLRALGVRIRECVDEVETQTRTVREDPGGRRLSGPLGAADPEDVIEPRAQIMIGTVPPSALHAEPVT
jgi:hypothetical protein